MDLISIKQKVGLIKPLKKSVPVFDVQKPLSATRQRLGMFNSYFRTPAFVMTR